MKVSKWCQKCHFYENCPFQFLAKMSNSYNTVILFQKMFLRWFFIVQIRAAWPFYKTSPLVLHRTKSFETETNINSCCGCIKYITVLLSVLKKCFEHFCSPDSWLSVKNRQTPPMSRNAPAKAGIMLTCVKIWPRRDQRSEFNEDHHDG